MCVCVCVWVYVSACACVTNVIGTADCATAILLISDPKKITLPKGGILRWDKH